MGFAVSVPGRPGVKPCEDASGAHLQGDAICVADGLGSAARAAEASVQAVAMVLEDLRPMLQAGVSTSEVQRLIHTLWTERTGDDVELSTTCLFAVRTPTHMVLGQLGDGLVLALNGRDVSRLEDEENWGDQTECLPGGTLRCAIAPLDTTVFLATDGVADDLVPERRAELAGHLAELLRSEGPDRTREEVQRWLTDWETPRSNDDRSIALLLPPETP